MSFSIQKNKCCSLDFDQNHNIYYRSYLIFLKGENFGSEISQLFLGMDVLNADFVKADMSKFIAMIIDSLNHDVTIGSVLDPTAKIHALLENRNKM